jgi:hypothetical protein
MKTVLLVTYEPRHRLLYEPGLKKHFQVEYRTRASAGGGNVDAIVYDIPSRQTSVDLRWLQQLEVPVVVLTPEDTLYLPSTPGRRVLTYPVRLHQILRALQELGVAAEGGGLVE